MINLLHLSLNSRPAGMFISVQMRTEVVQEWTYDAEQAFENPRRKYWHVCCRLK